MASEHVPHVRHVDWSFVDELWQPTGKYIKLPKNSKRQQWIKRKTCHKVRHYAHLPPKGNTYRRLFDYWRTLY